MARRSRSVEIGFVAIVAAAALAGCNQEEEYRRDWEQCVNQDNRVVDDRFCEQPIGTGPFSPGHPAPYYRWFYTPVPYGFGQTISSGSPTPSSGSEIARTSSGVVRGGFGSSAHFGGGS